MANRPAQYIPSDPLFKRQWFLNNTGQIEGGKAGFDINVIKVWPDYTGRGVLVAAIDDGFDQSHPDLVANYRANISWDLDNNTPGAEPKTSADSHGTPVGGLVAEVEGNGIGGVGVAWGANLVGYRSKFTDALNKATERMMRDGVSISTNSWGGMSYAFDQQANQESYVDAAKTIASQGRGGLGIVTLMAAGNDAKWRFNTNYDPLDNLPWAINIAASKADGLTTNYSTPGASVLVTAPGSEPSSIVATDRQGSAGYNASPGIEGNYTDTSESYFDGTSAATPIAAGVVALMLQANQKLGYRDVQEILAYSAKRDVYLNDSFADATTNHAHDWNGGGLLTGYKFGYGNIDALAAVRLAESWQKTNTASNLKIIDGLVQQSKLVVGSGQQGSVKASFANDARVEQMTVTVNLDTNNLQDLRLDLVAPDGTHSLLINYPSTFNTKGETVVLPTHLEYTLETVRDWGESLKGDWTLEVASDTNGSTVTLNNWSIKAYAADVAVANTQIFTNEFATFASKEVGRTTISSVHGTELNASAVTASSILDLSGGTSTIGGAFIKINDPQAFKKIITGDGDDTLIGNALDNLLMGGRGNNVMDGREGDDTAQFIGGRSMYDVVQSGANAYKVTSTVLSGGGVDQLASIEKLVFGTTTMVAKSALDQTESVGSMYDAMFDRSADAAGLKFWTNSVLDGANTELSVARAFTQSSEDNVVSLTNAQFVTRMYTDALDRAPDEVGYHYWLDALNAQAVDRAQVLISFIESDEFIDNELDLIALQIADLGDIWV